MTARASLAIALALLVALLVLPGDSPGALAGHKPDIVTKVRAEVVSATEVRLSWDAPTSGIPVHNYRYDHKLRDSTFSGSGSTTMETSVVIGGLTPGQRYDFHVRSCADDTADHCNVAQSIGNVELHTPWSGLRPSDLGGGDQYRILYVERTQVASPLSNITAYDTFLQNNRDSTFTNADVSVKVIGAFESGNARDHTGTAGNANVPIYWYKGGRVADGYNDFWDGSWNRNVRSDARYDDGMGVYATITGTGSANGDLVGGTLDIATGIGTDGAPSSSPFHATNSISTGRAGGGAAMGLTGGSNSAANFHVYALSEVLTVVLPPAAPNLTGTPKANDDSRDELTWTIPANNGAAITAYQVQRKATTDQNWPNTVQETTSTSYVYRKTGLFSSLTGYNYRVRAVNSKGEGAWSNHVTVAGRPNWSGLPTATAATDAVQVTLDWSGALSATGGKPITGYLYQWRTDKADNDPTGWNEGISVGASVTSATVITGLQRNTAYDFRVRASNADRASESGHATVTTADIVTVAVADAGAEEGDTIAFTVSLTSAVETVVTVSWATTDGMGTNGATAPDDFTPVTSSTVTIPINQTSATISVATVEDTTPETDETFTVTLSEPEGKLPDGVALATDPTATGTINNDDFNDYNHDSDGLIDVDSLAKLNAIRWDLDGDGSATDDPATANVDEASEYAAAFPFPTPDFGCPPAGCQGYELVADLDFDTDGDGDVGAGDAYWNSGSGWEPIGTTSLAPFMAILHGNGHIISNLYINKSGSVTGQGLFGHLASTASVSHLGLSKVNVTAPIAAGGLAANNSGTISAVFVTGSITGGESTGGIAGVSDGDVISSYFAGSVRGTSDVGGLVGLLTGELPTDTPSIVASYTVASVNASNPGNNVGGLVGRARAATTDVTILASYAAGVVTATGTPSGGLIGEASGPSAVDVTASYFDTDTSGRSHTTRGKTASEMQTPTAYTGIYASWQNVDTDGDANTTETNDFWHFGTASQYPALKHDGLDADTTATWQEFGFQVREAPQLTVDVTTDITQASLSWTAPTVPSQWGGPTITYQVYRDGVALLDAPQPGLSYTDAGYTTGFMYEYQVETLVDGEPTRRGNIVAAGTPTIDLSLSSGGTNLQGVNESANAVIGVTATFRGGYTHPVDVTVTVNVSAGTASTVDFTAVPDFDVTIPSGQTTVTLDQAFTFTPEDDPDPEDDETVIVSGTSSVTGIEVIGATLTIIDDDLTTQAATAAFAPTNIIDEGGTVNLLVSLSEVALRPFTVTVQDNDLFSVAEANSQQTIDTGGTTASFTLTAMNDVIDNPSRTATVRITLVTAGVTLPELTATLTITDDEPTPTVTLAVSPATINETGANTEATITATLDVGSSQEIAVSVITLPAFGDFSVSSNRVLTFPATTDPASPNLTSAGVVTITATDDDDGVNDEIQLYGTVTSATGAATMQDFATSPTLTIRDDDTPALIVDTDMTTDGVQTGPVNVAEGGTARYQVALATEPAGSVTVAAVSSDLAAVTVVNGPFTFSSSNWNTGFEVIVGGVEDPDAANETSVLLSHTLGGTASEYTSIPANTLPTITIIVDDDDTADITLSRAALTVPENGGTRTYTVALTVQPTGNVAVGVASTDTTEATVTPATLTFTQGNWNIAQTVTVTGVDDEVIRSGDSATVTHAIAPGSAAEFTAIAALPKVSVSVDDDDVPGVRVSTDTLTVGEGGTATYTVELNTQPSGDVVVDVASGDTGVATVDVSSLTFTTGNWSTAQIVTVTALGDADAADETVTLSHVINAGSTSDGDYDTVIITSVTVTVDDDETAGIAISPATLKVAVTEGMTATYTIALMVQPTGNVQIGVTSGDTSAVTVDTDATSNGSQTTLTFTSADWNMARTVTVTGVDDTDSESETVPIAHRVVDTNGAGEYDGVSVTVTTNVSDDDTPVVSIEPVSSPVPEGEDAKFRVIADRTVEANLIITLNVTATGSFGVTTGPDDITIPNSSTTATFTVATAGDATDEPDGEVTVSIVDGAAYDLGSPSSATVAISDNDDATDPPLPPLSRDVVDRAPLAVNLTPDFDGQVVPEQTYVQGERIETVRLPSARGGDGALSYSLSPRLPAGLSFDAAVRTISGTPTEAFAKARFTYTVTDADGDFAVLTFHITVNAPAAVADMTSSLPTAQVWTGVAVLRLGESELSVEVTADTESVVVRLIVAGDPVLGNLARLQFEVVTDEAMLQAPVPEGFRIADGQTVMNITLTNGESDEANETVNPATVCLPLTDAVRAEAGDQPLVLLHYDPETGWRAMSNSEVRTLADGSQVVCGDAMQFSPFAIGYGQGPELPLTGDRVIASRAMLGIGLVGALLSLAGWTMLWVRRPCGQG